MLEFVLEADAALRAWLATHHAPGLDNLMLFLSWIGRRGIVWLLLGGAAVLVRPENAAAAWRLALAAGLTFVVTDYVVKPTVGRVRPFTAVIDVRVIDERPDTYSFPSGHAATAAAGALAISRIWPRARAVWWMLAGLIALSRVYVGVHYPLDVLAGMLLGLATGWFALGGRALPRVRAKAGA